MNVSPEIERNRKEVLTRIQDCSDILFRPMQIGKGRSVSCFLIYVEVASSNMMLEDSVIGRFLNHMRSVEDGEVLEILNRDALGISDTKLLDTMEEAMAAMLAGNVVLFADGFAHGVKIGSKGYPGIGVMKAESEKVLRGSREAFSESEKINTALIRKRVRDTRMKVLEQPVGRYSHTMTALVYMEGVAYEPILERVRQKLETFEVDGALDSGVIEQLTEDTWYSPFPQYQTTERPDRAAMAVLEGRVVLVSDNSPEALILPTTWNSLFQTSDDYYRHFTIVSFLRVVRYIAAFLAVCLPGIYVAVINYHPQLLPSNLMLSLAEARVGVPFPGVIEVLLLEWSFELLREAGVRMPGPIGNTIGIVGGLIIGQAAVSANIVSPVVVVVVALTALGSFSIPNEEISEALRLFKYLIILLCGFFGILGLFFGGFLLVGHLAGLKSFGVAYLTPFSGSDLNQGADKKDGVLKGPDRLRTRRPVFASRRNRTRLRMK